MTAKTKTTTKKAPVKKTGAKAPAAKKAKAAPNFSKMSKDEFVKVEKQVRHVLLTTGHVFKRISSKLSEFEYIILRKDKFTGCKSFSDAYGYAQKIKAQAK